MPYPAGHRAAVKRRIVDSARRLFNRYGFEDVSIGRIMEGAGLTHGGFYSYFNSKGDLYTEVLGCFFTDPDWKNRWDGINVDLSSTDVGTQVVRAYLSRQHFEDLLPDAALGPARKPRVDFDRVAKTFRQVPPGYTGAITVKHRLDKQPIVPCGDTGITSFARQFWRNSFPLIVSQDCANQG